MTEDEAREAGSWVALKQFVEAYWRDRHPSVLPKLFQPWLFDGLSGRVSAKIEHVLYDTIKLAIVETATHELEAADVTQSPVLPLMRTIPGVGETS